MLTIAYDELLRYTMEERDKWRRFFSRAPQAMETPFQPGGRFGTVGKLIDHIFLVERRHLQRLRGEALADRTGLTGNNAPPLFDYGASVRRELEQYVRELDEDDAAEIRTFEVREQQWPMSARKLLFHILMTRSVTGRRSPSPSGSPASSLRAITISFSASRCDDRTTCAAEATPRKLSSTPSSVPWRLLPPPTRAAGSPIPAAPCALCSHNHTDRCCCSFSGSDSAATRSGGCSILSSTRIDTGRSSKGWYADRQHRPCIDLRCTGPRGASAVSRFGGSKGDQTEAWASRIMNWPLGEWLIGIVGVIIVVYGASEVVKLLQGKDDPMVDWSGVSTAVRRLCRFGVGSRGLIIITLGVFLVRAAVQHNPREAAGTRESLIELVGVVEGRWLLGLMAIGLLAYAVDQVVHSRYRRIRPVT